jgi:poly(hydroxyalkanoate) depolymerase family esterase
MSSYIKACTQPRARWLIAAALASALELASGGASAASIQGPIKGWEQGTEPSWVSMYIYVPDAVAPKPPILVTVHFCSGNAQGIFQQAKSGGMVAAADQYGFIMLLPQTTNNCWDVGTPPSLLHDGGGDTKAIVDQVKYTVATYGANADRVYVTGSSSGGMVTEAIVAAYPDVFKAGAEFAGVPAGCWKDSNPDGQWSSSCAGGMVTHTAQEWGDIARAMYPGYTGFRPRLQLWHGSADAIIQYTNHTEAIKQWTNVMALTNPPVNSTVSIGGHDYKRDEYKDPCQTTVLDVWSEEGGPHSTDANMNGQYTIPFFGLDTPGDVDPHAAVCMATGTGGMAAVNDDIPTVPATGCACRVTNTSSSTDALALALAGLTVATLARRKSKRSARVG